MSMWQVTFFIKIFMKNEKFYIIKACSHIWEKIFIFQVEIELSNGVEKKSVRSIDKEVSLIFYSQSIFHEVIWKGSEFLYRLYEEKWREEEEKAAHLGCCKGMKYLSDIRKIS